MVTSWCYPDAKAETPILWPPHAKSWLIGKDSDAGRDWWQEEKGTTEDEMAGWHHWLDGHESEWTPGVGDGQGGLACCDSWGRKESGATERLNWTELNWWWHQEAHITNFQATIKFHNSVNDHLFFNSVFNWRKDHCFLEFCCFLSNLNLNQPLWMIIF